MNDESDMHQPNNTSSVQYLGHELISYRDIVNNRDGRREIENNSESAKQLNAASSRSLTPIDSNELRDAESKIGSHLQANCALGIAAILFVFCVVGLIPQVSCGLHLCNKMDRSTGEHNFEFSAPLRHVWGAFTAGVGGILVASVHLFILRALSLGGGETIITAIRMRNAIGVYIKQESLVKTVISLVVFVFIGFAASWLVGGSFLFGSLVASCTAWLCLYIDTYGGLCILCSAAKSFEEAAQAMFRSASTIGVLTISIGVASIAISYLIFQDIRGLLGIAAGMSTVAFVSRILSSIYCVANTPARRTNRRSKIVTISAQIGVNIDGTTLSAVDFLESLVSAIAIAAISASMLPYVSSNPYAICVYNHLHIDFGCVAYGNTTQTVLFAAEICSHKQYYTQFPSLTFAQSNSLFAAVPFLVAILGLIIVAVCSIRFFVPLNSNQFSHVADLSNRMRRVARIQTIISAIFFFLGSVSISYALFGPRSSFHSRLAIKSFPRHEFSTRNLPDKCIPDLNGGTATSSDLPKLNNTLNAYKATNQFGETFPPPNQISWRMLVVLLLGQVLGHILEFFIMPPSDSLYPTSIVAKMNESGVEEIITQGLGSALTSTALPFMLILSTGFACYRMLGGYGIALASVSMLASSGVTFILGVFETIASSSEGISELNSLTPAIRSRVQVLRGVGAHYAYACRSVHAASALLIAISLVSYLLVVSRLIPTAKDIIGSVHLQSQRHIRSVDNLAAINPNVVVSIMFGFLLPVILVGLVLLGTGRTAYAMIVEARSETRQERNIGHEDGSKRLREYVLRATRHAVFEMLLPIVVTLVAPMCIGFGLGQRGLIAFLLSTSSCAYNMSLLLMTSGNNWSHACRAVKDKTLEGNSQVDMFRVRAAMIAEEIGLFLSRTSSPSMGIFIKLISIISVLVATLMKPDNSLWYVGVGILALLLLVNVVMLIARYKHQKQIRNRARLQFENEMRPGGRNEEEGTVSPFYEDRVLVSRHEVARRDENNAGAGLVDVDADLGVNRNDVGRGDGEKEL